MNKKSYLCVLFLMVTLSTFGAPRKSYLVKDGVAQVRICLPEKFSAATMLAAEELQAYLGKISGAKIDIQKSPYDEKLFKVIRMKAFILAPETVGMFTGGQDRDSFEIVQEKDKITIKSKSEDGVLFGVYAYLNSLGVRWLSPGEDGEFVPLSKDIIITEGETSETPSFWDRTMWYNGDAGWHIRRSDKWVNDLNDYWLWSLRNKLDLGRRRYSSYKNIAPTRIANQHYIHIAALHGVDMNEAPERFALYKNMKPSKRFPVALKVENGYRISTDSICMTHPENIKQAIQHSIEYIREHKELMIAPMALGDFSNICECNSCTLANNGIDPALDPNRVVWKFMNAVSKGVDEIIPGKGVGFYSCYGQMTRPPKGMKAHATVMGVITHVECNAHDIGNINCASNIKRAEDLKVTQNAGSRIKIRAYTMWYGNVQPLSILDSIKSFNKLGSQIYSCEVMGRDELRNIVHWCMAQLLWDTSKDPKELLKEYTDKYYGHAGEDVLEILTLLDEQVRSCRHIIFNTYFDILTPTIQNKCKQIIRKAQLMVTGRDAEHLRLFSQSLTMLFKRNNTYRSFAKVSQTRNPRDLKNAKKMFSNFKAWLIKEDVLEKCSPQVINAMQGFNKKLENFNLKHTFKHRKDIAEGEREERIKAIFSNTTLPGNTSHISLLPDVWKFSLDLNRSGFKRGWAKSKFNDSKWLDMSVYSFIQNLILSSPHFWYRTTFMAKMYDPNKRVYLRIGALDDDGTIYLNGKEVFKRYHINPLDWKSSFEIDITDVLLQGKKNCIAINGVNHMGGAGLWRGVGIYAK